MLPKHDIAGQVAFVGRLLGLNNSVMIGPSSLPSRSHFQDCNTAVKTTDPVEYTIEVERVPPTGTVQQSGYYVEEVEIKFTGI
jgi:hypothetical protein